MNTFMSYSRHVDLTGGNSSQSRSTYQRLQILQQCFTHRIHPVSPSLSWLHGKSMMIIKGFAEHPDQKSYTYTYIYIYINHYSRHQKPVFRTTNAISHCYDCQFESLNHRWQTSQFSIHENRLPFGNPTCQSQTCHKS